jgi:hypothetical protein
MPQLAPHSPQGVFIRLPLPNNKQNVVIELTNVVSASKEHVEPTIQHTPTSFLKVIVLVNKWNLRSTTIDPLALVQIHST